MSIAGAVMAKEPRPFRVELPDAERGRSQEDLIRFDKLQSEIKNRRQLGLSDAQVKERERQLAELELRPVEDADKAWAQAMTEETAMLAEGRGEEVDRLPSGKLHVRSRDSLLNLLNAGKLTRDQFDAGIDMRDAYEMRDADVGSQLGNLAPGAAHNNDRYVKTRLQRAKALQRVGTVEREVMLQCLHEPAALQMLRWICEHGHSIRSASSGSRSYDRNVAALAMALDVADAVIRGR